MGAFTEYIILGRTRVRVSRLGRGTMNLGEHTSERARFAILEKALQMGINFFDTANSYGGVMEERITEQIIVRRLTQGGGRREQIFLATRVYDVMGEGPNEQCLSTYHIQQACHATD